MEASNHKEIQSIKRDLSFDFIKGILIFLVVYGHLVPQFLSVSYNDRLDTVIIYTFHMPLFIFISGYFGTHTIRKSFFECTEKLLHRIVIPAIIWTFINFIVFHLGDNHTWGEKLLSSFRSVWYLYCMCYLYIVGCLIEKSKRFWTLAVLIIVIGFFIYPCPIVAYIDYFQIIRQWPLFVLGILYYSYKIKITPPTFRKLLFFSIIVYVLVFAFLFYSHPLNYILSRQNYLLRAVLYLSGAIMMFILLKVVYSYVSGSFFASVFILLGQNSLGIYVMNEILIKLMKEHCAFMGIIPLWILSIIFTFVLLHITLLLKRNIFTAKILLGEKK